MTSLATGDVHREDDEGLPSETMLIEYDVEQDVALILDLIFLL